MILVVRAVCPKHATCYTLGIAGCVLQNFNTVQYAASCTVMV